MLRVSNIWLKRRSKDVKNDDDDEVKAENTRILVVRDLPQSASAKDVEHYFSLYGTVLQVQNLSMDIDDERISLVKFNDPVDCRRLYELSKTEFGLQIHGKRIKLETLKDTNDDEIVWNNPENEININDYLNDSCLSEIFRLLPLESLASASLVCRRWQDVAQKTVRKDLEVDHLCTQATIGASYQLFETFGDRLTTLRLTLCDFKNTRKILKAVQKNCKNLKHFSLRCADNLQITQTTLTEFREDCKDSDKAVSMLLSHLNQLESLKLADLSMITDKSLTTVHETLQSLHLENCCMLRGNEIGCNVKNIKKLTLTKNTTLTDEEIRNIIESKPFLFDVTLSGCFPMINGDVFQQVVNMGNQLTHIDFSYNTSLTIPYLEKILDSCHYLEALNVSGINMPRINDGKLLIEKLGSKRNIKKVVMNSLSIPDYAFQALTPCPQLREIECRGNPNFTNEAFSHIIAMCNNLNVFDVRDNFCLTNYCLLTFMQYPRTKPLKLILGGTHTFDIEPWMNFQNVEYVKRCDINYTETNTFDIAP